MRYLGAFGLSALLFLSSLTPVGANGGRKDTHAHVRSVLKTFRLQVAGRPPIGMTYWVAYGPLDDRFGLDRLRAVGTTTYQVSAWLPASGHTTFAFLAGHGSLQTQFGPAPADPVITIKLFGPLPVSGPDLPVVRWYAPAG